MTPAEKRRDGHLRRTYGISLADYNRILVFQGGVCAVCGKPPDAAKNLSVDHHHGNGLGGSGGFVRGLLHNYCNRRVVGRFKEGTLLRAAADYLDDPPAPYVLGFNHAVPKKKRQPRKRPRNG